MSKMPAKTLAALKGSIKHWEKNAAAKLEDAEIGAGFCDLCVLFNITQENYSDRCIGCPVMSASGARFCDNTPYAEVDRILTMESSDEWPTVALAELNFLRSLLPDEEKVKTDESL